MRAGRLRAAAARASATGAGRHETLRYGAREREAIEIFSADGAGELAFAMLHGGWWQEGSIDDGARYAAAVTHLGVDHVAVGYPLAPEATLSGIVDAVGAALAAFLARRAAAEEPSPRLILGGHSAGAHLAAMMATDRAPVIVRDRVAGLLLIGGAFDLAPIAESYVNDLVGMSRDEAAELSPVNRTPVRRLPVTIRVGEHEPSEFHRHASLLRDRWSGAAEVTLGTVPGRDHFDVLDELDRVGGALHRDLADLVRRVGA